MSEERSEVPTTVIRALQRRNGGGGLDFKFLIGMGSLIFAAGGAYYAITDNAKKIDDANRKIEALTAAVNTLTVAHADNEARLRELERQNFFHLPPERPSR